MALGISRLDLATQYFVLTGLGFDGCWFRMVDVDSTGAPLGVSGDLGFLGYIYVAHGFIAIKGWGR